MSSISTKISQLPAWLVEARAAVSTKAVFFAVIMYREADTVITDRVRGIMPNPTACTDGKNIYINEEFFLNELRNTSERVFVICHEIWHIIARHAQKMAHYTVVGLCGRPFYPPLFQWSADAIINATLDKSGIGTQPASAIRHPEVTGDETVEDVYEKFLKQVDEKNDGQQQKLMKLVADAQKNGGLGDDGEGGADRLMPGSGKEAAPGMEQGDFGFNGAEGFDGLAPAAGNAPGETQMQLAVAAGVAAQKMAGTMPAGLKRFIDEILDPQVDWRQEMRDYFVTTVGKDERTWKRPNRRKLVFPGIYMPRKIGLRCGPVVQAFDTSGSMSNHEIAAVLAEDAAILSDVRPQSCHVIWCDAKVDRVDEVEEAAELITLVRAEASGGGGTLFSPVFDWVNENLDEPPCVLIYGTDGMPSEWPDESIADYPVIWLMTTDRVAPWGRTIRIHV